MTPTSLTGVLERIQDIVGRFSPASDRSDGVGRAQPDGVGPGKPDFASTLSGELDAAGQGDAPSGAAGRGDAADAGPASLPRAERDMIVREARRQGVDPALALAVVLRESGGNPQAVSPAGAMGLMQLMPGTARDLGVADPFDPQQNVDGGLRYLRDRLREFGSVPLALAAYNAGSGAVYQWGGIPPFPETRQYVKTVMQSEQAIAGGRGAATGIDSASSTTAGIRPAGSAGPRVVQTGSVRSPHAAAGESGSVTQDAGRARADSAAGAAFQTAARAVLARPTLSGSALEGAAGTHVAVEPAAGPQHVLSAAGGPQSALRAPEGIPTDSQVLTHAASESLLEIERISLAGAGSAGDARTRDGGAHGSDGSGTNAPGGLPIVGGAGGGPGAPGPSASQASAPSDPSGSLRGTPPAASPTNAVHVTLQSDVLGSVSMSLADRAGTIQGRIVVPTPALGQTLASQVGTLRDALAAHQMTLSDLTITPTGGWGQPARHQQDAYRPQGAPRWAARYDPGSAQREGEVKSNG
jgi:hypothetical protein